jgi:hypothetical protein
MVISGILFSLLFSVLIRDNHCGIPGCAHLRADPESCGIALARDSGFARS